MNDFFKITKIRLVNFHNVGTTTLELPEGGHLFLLGDNASGKTTVLDAVHFVLTGGRSMEFNSAARIAGAKNSGGRTVQGIVMRYNIETRGPMRPEGGITYAGLEIAGRNSKPVSVCVGVSCRSMEEEYKSWGIIFDGPIADAPLCEKEENGAVRVLPSEALKEKMKGAGQFYGRIGAYTDALAERFFGGNDTYADVCQLLSTGKAYREIASRAGDYDKLFRSLLQEPDKEVFENLIRDLKTLEESKVELESLKQRAKYVQDIVALRDGVRDARLDELCARWQEATLRMREYEAAGRTLHQLHDAEASRLEGLHEDERRLDDEEKRQNLRLAELQRKDTENLVGQEKNAKLAVDEKHHASLAAKQKQMVCQSKRNEAAEKLETAKSSLVKRLSRGGAEVRKLGKPLSFSTSGLVVSYDEASRAEQPEEEVFKLSYQTYLAQAEAESASLLKKIQSAEAKLEALRTDAETARAEIAAKKAQEEAVPLAAGFLQARTALRQGLTGAMPLYEGLVPAVAMRPKDLAMLEEIIGDDVLATWIVDKEHADEARKILFGAYPGQSLAVAEEDDNTPCDWLGRFFNLEESKPDAILVLRQQIAAKAGPHAEVFFGQNVLHFRCRERAARQTEPRLIGNEARREQIRREIRALEKELDGLERKIRETEKSREEVVKDRDALTAFLAFLRVEQESLPREANEVKTLRGGEAIAKNDFVNARVNMENCEEEEAHANAKWQDIKFLMRKADLDEAFADRVKALEKIVDKARKEHNECVGEVRSCEDAVKRLDGQMAENAGEYAKIAKSREPDTEKLATCFTAAGNSVKTLDESVALRCGERKDHREALAEWERIRHDATVDGARSLKDKITQTEGMAFGFVYEEGADTLMDRRGRTIDTVMQEGEKQVKDQEAVINDNTRHVFKQIVMDELIGNLQMSVMRLEEMTRRIGKLLKDRVFGNNRYAFSISPNEGYEAIVRIVRGYRSFNPSETEEELKHFLETNQDQLMSTEVGVIPEMLDYRNWFRYELKILMADSEGKIIDRRVKSMGSGGEQAVPNYLLILMIANFLYERERIHLPVLIFDEAFYGIDAGRRDQILAFADDLGLQLFVASPDQDGVKKEIPLSTSVLVIKDRNFDVHLYPYHWKTMRQGELLESAKEPEAGFEKETE